jgi:hypothetical protein
MFVFDDKVMTEDIENMLTDLAGQTKICSSIVYRVHKNDTDYSMFRMIYENCINGFLMRKKTVSILLQL